MIELSHLIQPNQESLKEIVVDGGRESKIKETFETLLLKQAQRVIVNVGGTKFETFVDTFTKHGTKTMLGK